MNQYTFITAFNGVAYFQDENGNRLEKKVYKVPKKMNFIAKYYIIHKNEKIYFNNNITKILTK